MLSALPASPAASSLLECAGFYDTRSEQTPRYTEALERRRGFYRRDVAPLLFAGRHHGLTFIDRVLNIAGRRSFKVIESRH